MEESVLLLNMTLLLSVGAICTVIFKKLKMPTIIGYLATGIILASYWASQSEDSQLVVEILSDLGMVFLMFCIGMELNIKKIRKSGMFALMVVMIQVPIMILGGYIFGMLMGWDSIQCIFFGAIISGSSTAVVTAVLAETDKLNREEVETIILITVIEDVAQVIILSMTSPLLVGSSMNIGSILWMLLIIVLFMAGSMVLGLIFIPKILDWIGDKMPEEVLLVSALGMCFALSLLSVVVGMSMAIGAFLMGVIVSQSHTAKSIEHDVSPMKNIFMGIFFISVGLKIFPDSIIDNILLIVLFFAAYGFLKTLSVFVAFFIGNKSMRLGFISSVSLVAMGEFAFIISKEAYDAGVISQSVYTSVIGAALLSMIMLPIISKHSDFICDKVEEYSPSFIYNTFRKAEKFRSDQYAKMALSSKSTADKFKRNLTLAYLEAVVLVVMIIVFFFATPGMARFLYDAVAPFSYNDCYTLILMLEFIALMVPLYLIVKNVKFAEKVMLDIERKAVNLGMGDLDSRVSRFYKEMVKVNTWMIVLLLDFLILFIMPVNVDFWTHVFVVLFGAGCIIFLYFIKYWRRN